jgi:hypothetical protein
MWQAQVWDDMEDENKQMTCLNFGNECHSTQLWSLAV